MKDSQQLYYFVTALATAVGIAYKLGGSALKIFKKELESLQEDRKKLRVVFQELTPNHGSSLKDKVNRVEQAIERNNTLTEKIFVRQNWLMERQEVPMFETDANGLFTWVNEEFARLFGKSSSHFLGNGWKNIIHPEDRERVEEHWNTCIKDKIDSEITFRVIDEDRTITILMDANRTEGGYLGSFVRKGCNSKKCPDCKCPESCEVFQRKKRDIMRYEVGNELQLQ